MLIGSKEWREKEVVPKFNTDDWQKFVLSLLKKDEMKEEYPSAAGLHRVALLLLDITELTTEVVKAPSADDRSATVSAKIRAILPDSGGSRYVSYTSSADVSPNNTKEPFCYHPVATAETKAIGRALKLLLNLKIHTYEEMLDDGVSYDGIEEKQVKSIRSIINRLKIDADKFLAMHVGIDLDTLNSGSSGLSRDDGKRLIELLNVYQNDGVPETVMST